MKRLWVVGILLIARVVFGAPTDYKVDNQGNIHGYGLELKDKAYIDPTAGYLDRSALLTINRAITTAPSGVLSNLYSIVQGVGNDTTFVGVSAAYLTAIDYPSVNSSNKGVLYGLAIDVRPRVARNNSPYDDVAGIVIGNQGTAKGTEAVYVGYNPSISGKEWLAQFSMNGKSNYGLVLGANANVDYAINLTQGTINNYPIYLQNNSPIVGINAAGTTDVGMIRLSWLDELWLRDKKVFISDLALSVSPNAGDTQGGEIRLLEEAANGTNYVGFRSPIHVSTSYTLKYPDAIGSANQALIIDSIVGEVASLKWGSAGSGMANPMTTKGAMIYNSAVGDNPASLVAGSTGQCVVMDASGVPVWGSCTATGSAAGSSGDVQLNVSGSFGVDTGVFTYDTTNHTGKILGSISGQKVSLVTKNASTGSTASNEIRIGTQTIGEDHLRIIAYADEHSLYSGYARIMNKGEMPLVLGTNDTDVFSVANASDTNYFTMWHADGGNYLTIYDGTSTYFYLSMWDTANPRMGYFGLGADSQLSLLFDSISVGLSGSLSRGKLIIAYDVDRPQIGLQDDSATYWSTFKTRTQTGNIEYRLPTTLGSGGFIKITPSGGGTIGTMTIESSSSQWTTSGSDIYYKLGNVLVEMGGTISDLPPRTSTTTLSVGTQRPNDNTEYQGIDVVGKIANTTTGQSLWNVSSITYSAGEGAQSAGYWHYGEVSGGGGTHWSLAGELHDKAGNANIGNELMLVRDAIASSTVANVGLAMIAAAPSGASQVFRGAGFLVQRHGVYSYATWHVGYYGQQAAIDPSGYFIALGNDGIPEFPTGPTTYYFTVSRTGVVQAAGGASNYIACWKADGKTLSHCQTTIVGASCDCL